ncbi:CLUMA_CG018379, isoform A [Clunio marinus]|uniref:CLUMA_CG018379, isoform A n=1 Tax=Clunio marinus TaxID=568069 RepID=A0A1J1J0P7_9DIPT|nr:CLUMA_CG018379, isoform A [Clunio marinus]
MKISDSNSKKKILEKLFGEEVFGVHEVALSDLDGLLLLHEYNLKFKVKKTDILKHVNSNLLEHPKCFRFNVVQCFFRSRTPTEYR